MWNCASRDGRMKEIPFLQLPISKLPPDFFPLTCRTCVDYTNVLADITVGYMGGQGEQWLLVRNERGEELLALLGDEVRTVRTRQRRQAQGPGDRVHEEHRTRRRRAAAARHAELGAAARRLADAARSGRAGLEFARARVEMKAVETVMHLRRAYPEADAEHGARACLGAGPAVWPDEATERTPCALIKSSAMIPLLVALGLVGGGAVALHAGQAARGAGGAIRRSRRRSSSRSPACGCMCATPGRATRRR